MKKSEYFDNVSPNDWMKAKDDKNMTYQLTIWVLFITNTLLPVESPSNNCILILSSIGTIDKIGYDYTVFYIEMYFFFVLIAFYQINAHLAHIFAERTILDKSKWNIVKQQL